MPQKKKRRSYATRKDVIWISHRPSFSLPRFGQPLLSTLDNLIQRPRSTKHPQIEKRGEVKGRERTKISHPIIVEREREREEFIIFTDPYSLFDSPLPALILLLLLLSSPLNKKRRHHHHHRLWDFFTIHLICCLELPPVPSPLPSLFWILLAN